MHEADKYYDLSKVGVEKKYHEDFDPREATQLLEQIQQELNPAASVEESSCAEPDRRRSVPSGTQPDPDVDQPQKLSSPACYMEQFKDW
jgi:hypothetical protein